MQRTENTPVNKKIKAHVLYFDDAFIPHIEIVLETGDEEYYRINVESPPKSKAAFQHKKCMSLLARANKTETIEIESDINEIIRQWNEKYKNESHRFGLLRNNCADVSAWFLEEFADIKTPGPCALPITLDFFCCNIFSPSFFQCCTVPGRVFKGATIAKNNKETPDNLPDNFYDETASFRL